MTILFSNLSLIKSYNYIFYKIAVFCRARKMVSQKWGIVESKHQIFIKTKMGTSQVILLQTPGACQLPCQEASDTSRLRSAYRPDYTELCNSKVSGDLLSRQSSAEEFHYRQRACSVRTDLWFRASTLSFPPLEILIMDVTVTIGWALSRPSACWDTDFYSEVWTFISIFPQNPCALISSAQQEGVWLRRLPNIGRTLPPSWKTDGQRWSIGKPWCAGILLCI